MNARLQISNRTFEFSPVILLAFLVFLAAPFIFMHRYSAAVMLLAAPLFLTLAISPRVFMYLYVLTLSFFIYPVPGIPLLITDYVIVGMILAFVIDFLVNIRENLSVPRISTNYLIFIGAMFVSALAAYDPMHSITPVLRAGLQLVLLIMFYNRMDKADIARLAKLYFWVMVVQAVFIAFSFISLGGIHRVFGIAGTYADDLAMVAFPIGLAFAVWSKSRTQSRLYGLGTIVILAGLLSTQSRFPIFTVAWVGFIVLVVSWHYAGKAGLYATRRRIKLAFLASGTIIVLILAGLTIFTGIVGRFDYVFSRHMGSSVLMRFSLWKTALLVFLKDPLLGIGPGNFRFVDSLIPSVKFVVIRYLVRGLSAHNMVLHYMAETGILGVTALVWLYARYFKIALTHMRNTISQFPMVMRMAMFGVALTIFGEIFYMDGWMWGLTAFPVPLFMALTCRMVKEDHAG